MLKHCTLCPLHKNNPVTTYPIQGYGKSDIMVIAHAPYYDDILVGRPATIYYDLVKKIFDELNKDFYYTHMIKCLGKYTKSNVKTCSKWLMEEINQINPRTIFILGQDPKKYLAGKKDKLSTLVGKPILIRDRTYIPNFHPAYVLNNGKSIYETFVSVFRSNI